MYKDNICNFLNGLRYALNSRPDCEVVTYGDGLGFIPEHNVEKIVDKEQPDVIMIGNNQYVFEGLDKVKVPKAMKCSDPHSTINKHVSFIKKNNIDLVLMIYGEATPQYKKYLPNRSFGSLPYSINPDMFKNYGLERTVDVMCAGAVHGTVYPLRQAIWNALPKMKGLKTFIGRLPCNEYIKKINETKIFAFGNGHVYVDGSPKVYAQAKICEVMACETLCMMDTPDMASELHLIPDYNYVEINESNFKEKITYYLENKELREKIAQRGYETVTKYHTHQIRARELKEQLERIKR